MSITLTINGTDRTERVEMDSLRIENILTRRRDVCDFNIISHSGNSVTPVLGQEVIIRLDGTKVFGGVITELEQKVTSYKVIMWKVSCQDYTRLLDRKLVAESYENMTVNAIIADIKATYFPSGFTITNVNCTLTIKSVKFNYLPISKCLEELADITGYDFYVDYDKDVHFFEMSTNPASIDIEDANGSHIYDSLVIRKDNSQVRNSIIVRGGEYLGSSFTGEWEGNGTDYTIPLPYRFSEFEATLTGNPLTVGVDYINAPDDYHVLYNFQEKVLKFKDTDIPSSGAVLRYSGLPYLPVIVRLRSPSAIDTMSAAEGGDGVYEYLIVDKTITTREGARARAAAEIETYATTMSEGEFTTETAGLRAGQRIRVNSSSRSIDEYFVINRVTLEQFDSGSFLYHVSLVTTKTFDFYDLIKRFLISDSKNLTIDPNETVDLVFDYSDTFTFSDTLGTFSTHGTTYRWGPSSNQGRWNFATWS